MLAGSQVPVGTESGRAVFLPFCAFVGGATGAVALALAVACDELWAVLDGTAAAVVAFGSPPNPVRSLPMPKTRASATTSTRVRRNQ